MSLLVTDEASTVCEHCGAIDSAQARNPELCRKCGAILPTPTPAAPSVHAFQTDRLYTENGQRIAWCALPDARVLMIDADRCIEYVLSLAPSRDGFITDAMVLDAYDHNRTHPKGWHPCAHADASEHMSRLYEAARKVRAPRRSRL